MPKVHLCSFGLRNGAPIFSRGYKSVTVPKSHCFFPNSVTARFVVTVATARSTKRHGNDKGDGNDNRNESLKDADFLRDDDDSTKIFQEIKNNRQVNANSSSSKSTKDKEEEQYEIESFKIIRERILQNPEYEIEENNELYKIIRNDIDLNNGDIPSIPTKLQDINEIDDIIKKLNWVSINRDKPNISIISKIFNEIINSNLLSIESYNTILQFYCKIYDFKNAEMLFNKLLSKETNVYPNIDTYNLIFNYLSRTNNKKISRFEIFNKYLNYLITDDVKINSFSLLIFFKNFNNKKFKNDILSFINYKKFDVEPIICDIIKLSTHTHNNHSNKFSAHSVNEILHYYNVQLNSDVLLLVMDNYINRMQDPVKAWEYLMKHKDISEKNIDKLIKIFIKNYINKNEIYNCIAIINLFEKNFPSEFKDGKIEVEVYKNLYESMINFKSFNNWILLTKFFYFKSLVGFNDLFEGNADNDKIIEFGKLNYDLKFELSEINIKEIKIMEIIISELTWEDNKPIRNLNDNNKKFIRNAKLISCK
ncbi:hypothetical protein B5S30_g5330 [[Candida] boidinii]|nr:hypothetical protein B5S30_g5330 [[Candida] boidinii]GMF99655.1 unnamed protein product [[Candida] boidinii]